MPCKPGLKISYPIQWILESDWADVVDVLETIRPRVEAGRDRPEKKVTIWGRPEILGVKISPGSHTPFDLEYV